MNLSAHSRFTLPTPSGFVRIFQLLEPKFAVFHAMENPFGLPSTPIGCPRQSSPALPLTLEP